MRDQAAAAPPRSPRPETEALDEGDPNSIETARRTANVSQQAVATAEKRLHHARQALQAS